MSFFLVYFSVLVFLAAAAREDAAAGPALANELCDRRGGLYEVHRQVLD